MSLISLKFEPLVLQTAHPFGISYGSSIETRNVLVTLSYEGFIGLGEAAPAHYHNETDKTVCAVFQQWQKPGFLGSDPFAIVDIMQHLDKSITGNYSAKAAVEMALYDLIGKICHQPVYRLLGLSNLPQPMCDFTIGIDNLDVIEQKVKEALKAKHKIFKVKQGTAYDREIIQLVRKLAPKIPLRVDANGAWTPKQAIAMAEFLAQYNVEFIEQPLPKYASIEDWCFVRKRSPLPVFADESICRANDVARLAGTIDGVVVKLAKTGGIWEALKVIHAARAQSLQIMFGCMIESSLGVTAAAHLSGLVDYLDLDGALLLAFDPFIGAQYQDGYLKVPNLPGLGVTVR